MSAKPRIATVSLAGCFGCHMSILDIDERILQAGRAGRVRSLARSTTTRSSPAAARSASSRAAAATRRTCTCSRTSASTATCSSRWATAPSTAACPPCATTCRCASASRRPTSSRPGVYNPGGIIPNDPEIPLLLNRVYPCHEVVKIDHFIPGCPPPADAIWDVAGRAADRQAGRDRLRRPEVRLRETTS